MTHAIRPIELLYEKAMELSDADRLRLANLLYASAADFSEDEWDATDEEELDEIEAAIDSGRMKTYPYEEVHRRMWERIRQNEG